jgi:hypothetical protein
MKKMIILAVFASFFVTPLFCETVKSDALTSKYGISYAERQKSNYIEKGGHSFRYLGNGTWDVRSASSSNSSKNSGLIKIAVIAGIIHIILTFCVSKMKGPYWACFYFFLAPVALLILWSFADRGFGVNRRRW